MQDDKKNSQKMKKVISKRRKIVLLTAFTLSMALCLGPLIHPLPAAEKREVRELEKCALKLAKSGCSLLFNGACYTYMLTYASECNMRFFFKLFYFRHYFHECVARVEIIGNKMTRKIYLILHELRGIR